MDVESKEKINPWLEAWLNVSTEKRSSICVPTRGVAATATLAGLLSDFKLVSVPRGDTVSVVGWGRKPSAERAKVVAERNGLPLWQLEDGFLRSYGTGERFPPLSLVMDSSGIYYDSTAPSALENLLASGGDLLDGIADDVYRAKRWLLKHGLSKYNHAPDFDTSLLRNKGRSRVLIVDQTFCDLSVTLGGADAATFEQMLAAARAENPQATIYIKTHPEVSNGRKSGYLTSHGDDADTVLLRDAANPYSLIKHMDRVYVVTSTMGFEALLAAKPVTVFGMPWYAGWGATDDRQHCSRRNRRRSVDELFAAAYFHYSRYLNPETHRLGTIFDVIAWLIRQHMVSDRLAASIGLNTGGRMIGVGFRRWKATNIKPMLALDMRRVVFAESAKQLPELNLNATDSLIFWGRDAPPGVAEVAASSGARLVRMEDGFVRSVGLGSDFIKPLSLVLEDRGIYFDPCGPSEIEDILNTAPFSEAELAKARKIRKFIVKEGLTKYNLERREVASWSVQHGSSRREVVLVTGQVEDDASIRYGCTKVKTNLALLKYARRAHPNAFVVYKPHPDVMSGNRAGGIAPSVVLRYANHIETNLSVVSCIEAADVIHTMTSLSGFDALLRKKRVCVYGQPFYAGWGLTEDFVKNGAAFARRKRVLSLDALVAGVLLRYPFYWDWKLQGYTSCSAVLRQLRNTRNVMERSGNLEKLRGGYVRRQVRKAKILIKAWA